MIAAGFAAVKEGERWKAMAWQDRGEEVVVLEAGVGSKETALELARSFALQLIEEVSDEVGKRAG